MTAPQRFTLKRDQYRQTRGGWSRFLNLYCRHCDAHLLLYQKDGSGTLFRAYLDRIVAPEALSVRQHITNFADIPNLVCESCKAVIGTPYIWEDENRFSYLLDQQGFYKKLGKGLYPPEK